MPMDTGHSVATQATAKLAEPRRTHFEEFAHNLHTVREDLVGLEERLRELVSRINAPCQNEGTRQANAEPTEQGPHNGGLFSNFHTTFQAIVTVRDDIERHIRRLEESI